MLLVIDIGNTNIVFGVYHEGKLVNHWRLSTAMTKTVDEYAILLNSLLYIEKIRLSEIHSAILSCVVPPLLIPFEIVCRKYIGIMPIVVEPAHRGIEGMCLDADGNIVAVAGWTRSGPGPRVYVFAPDGAMIESHALPADLPNKCCFGGRDLGTLYVTTGGGQLYAANAGGRRGRT